MLSMLKKVIGFAVVLRNSSTIVNNSRHNKWQLNDNGTENVVLFYFLFSARYHGT